jgi:hypothetical protein
VEKLQVGCKAYRAPEEEATIGMLQAVWSSCGKATVGVLEGIESSFRETTLGMLHVRTGKEVAT